jgi:hypothetical protein
LATLDAKRTTSAALRHATRSTAVLACAWWGRSTRRRRQDPRFGKVWGARHVA